MENEINENNEISENIEDISLQEENSENVVDNQESTENDLVDIPSPAADYYYDYYYTQVLNKLDNIGTSQNTMINNEDLIIEKLDDNTTIFSCLTFTVIVFFIYIFIKDLMSLNK